MAETLVRFTSIARPNVNCLAAQIIVVPAPDEMNGCGDSRHGSAVVPVSPKGIIRKIVRQDVPVKGDRLAPSNRVGFAYREMPKRGLQLLLIFPKETVGDLGPQGTTM